MTLGLAKGLVGALLAGTLNQKLSP